MSLDDLANKFFDESSRALRHRLGVIKHMNAQLEGVLQDVKVLREKLHGSEQEIEGLLQGVPVDDDAYMKSVIEDRLSLDTGDSAEWRMY